jgi:hypothetical protein
MDHDVIETLSSIKILEQQGFLSMSESVYQPSQVSVIAGRTDVELLKNNL